MREYTLKIRTPQPKIKSLRTKDFGKIFLDNVYQLKWDNNSDQLVIAIEGKNFFVEDPAAGAGGRCIEWVGSDPDVAVEVAEQNDTLLTLKLNLSRLKHTGLFNLRVVNFDRSASETVPVSIVPLYASTFTQPSRSWDIPVNTEQTITLNCNYPYEIERLFFGDAQANEITDGSYINCKVVGPNLVELKLRYITKIYPIWYYLWHSDEPVMLYPEGNAILRPVDDNKVSFGLISKYEGQVIKAGDEYPLNKTPNIDGGDVTLISENGKYSLSFTYIVKSEGSNKRHYLRATSDINLNLAMSGRYNAQFKGAMIGGELKVNEVPGTESIRWINKDEDLDKIMRGSIYATGKVQHYMLLMNFEYNYHPEENDFTVFGVPLTNPTGGANRYTFEVTLPATIAAGDPVNLTYRNVVPVPIKGGAGGESVLAYNRPAEMPGFITVYPDDRDAGKYDLYSNLGEYKTVAFKTGKPKLKIKVHNYKSFHAGNQNLKVICTLRNVHGTIKASNAETQVNNDAVQEKSIGLAEGDSIEFTVNFNTISISPWDMVDVTVVYNKKNYSFPYVVNDEGKALTIQYTKESNMKFTYGLGIPTTSMAVYRFNDKDWTWSPFTVGIDAGFDWTNKDGTSKGQGLGVELGFFQFPNLFDNESESFAFSITPFYKHILGYKKKADLMVPIYAGVGAVPEWKNGTNYWNIAVMFQVRFDGVKNRIER